MLVNRGSQRLCASIKQIVRIERLAPSASTRYLILAKTVMPTGTHRSPGRIASSASAAAQVTRQDRLKRQRSVERKAKRLICCSDAYLAQFDHDAVKVVIGEDIVWF